MDDDRRKNLDDPYEKDRKIQKNHRTISNEYKEKKPSSGWDKN